MFHDVRTTVNYMRCLILWYVCYSIATKSTYVVLVDYTRLRVGVKVVVWLCQK